MMHSIFGLSLLYICPLSIIHSQAYSSSRPLCRHRSLQHATKLRRRQLPSVFKSSENDHGSSNNEAETTPDDLGIGIIRDCGDELSDEMWREMEQGAPTKFEVMKSLLGINSFTYIIAVLIAFFLSMNAMYGPGWLGQLLGWENVGTFTRVSGSLPIDIDLNGEQYLL